LRPGGSQASNVLLDIKTGQLKKQGKEITEEDKKKFLDEIKKRYEEQTNVLYAASRLWVDEIIDPADTRKIVSYCIELANNNPEMKKFNVPVVMDVTHSLQQPNQSSGVTGGKPELISTIARAAMAAGADGIFIETHPNPAKALSDGANMLRLDLLEKLLVSLLKVQQAVR